MPFKKQYPKFTFWRWHLSDKLHLCADIPAASAYTLCGSKHNVGDFLLYLGCQSHCHSISTAVQFGFKMTPEREIACFEIRGSWSHEVLPFLKIVSSPNNCAYSCRWYSCCVWRWSILLKPGICGNVCSFSSTEVFQLTQLP